MKDHLIFDTIDATSIIDTDSVGAYVRAGSGGAIVTYHGDNQANAATANFVPGNVTAGTDSITLTAHGFNNGDKVQFTTDDTLPDPLAPATNYWVIYVDANTIKVAASQSDAELGIAIDLIDGGVGNHTVTAQPYDIRALDVYVVNPVEVTATDLDIRDLTQADEITVFQGTDPWIIGDGGGSITVDAVDLDIRDLTAASDSVASWTNDGAGNPISSTGTALDVNISSSDIAIDVDLDGVYNGVTNTNPDNVGMIAHARGAGPLGDADQTFRSSGNQANSDAVVAANVWGLDVNAFGMVYNGATWDRLPGDTTGVYIADGGNSITVDAVDLDIRDLTQTDEITVFQGTDPWVVNDAALAATAIANASNTLSVAGTSQDVVVAPLANRKYLWIYNFDNTQVYIGATGVTLANGFPISPGSLMELRAGPAVDIEFVGKANKTPEIRTLELS